MAVKTCQIYGVITKVLPDGEIAICEPVFSAISQNEKSPKKFYRAKLVPTPIPNWPNLKLIEDFEEFDISMFGSPLFLPISKSKINDGKEYLIIYHDTNNLPIDKSGIIRHRNCPVVSSLKSNDFWIPRSVTIGILFPNKFITVMLGGLSTNELKKLLDESSSKK